MIKNKGEGRINGLPADDWCGVNQPVTFTPVRVANFYTLYAGHSYEPGTVIGVFSTLEKAEAAERLLVKHGSYSVLRIDEFKLDEPV